jgi:hypothetical protein
MFTNCCLSFLIFVQNLPEQSEQKKNRERYAENKYGFVGNHHSTTPNLSSANKRQASTPVNVFSIERPE